MEKKPEWLKVRYNQDAVNEVAELMRDLKLNTVCKEANCPNLGECYRKHTSTFMILGSICTRNCRFCNVTTGHPLPPDPEEPMNVAKAAKKLGLRHVVLTCSTRDDLPDGGAEQFAKTVRAIREVCPGTTVETLARLKPAFKKDGGIVTAGNSSGINDGAAAIVVMSEEKAKELGVKPMATWVGGALGGVDPSIMGVGPVAAVNKLMKKLDMKVADMDLIEANEAFAAQSLAVGHDLGFDPEKLNVNGGAIALGHPVGASGCRILVTLLHEMQRRDAKTGLATLCIGGGMGCATVVKRD